jgi:uncharacterized protein
MRDALYAIAKAPRPGLAKTRLARSLGEDDALLLYRAFLADLAKRFGSTPYGLGWYVTPRDAWPEIRALTGETGPVLFQGEGDLTERQRGLFHAAFGEGAERVVLIATDSPHLPVRVVEDAFGLLEERDVVLGPTLDGGYYLIGMRGWRDFPREVPMSTATVLEDVPWTKFSRPKISRKTTRRSRRRRRPDERSPAWIASETRAGSHRVRASTRPRAWSGPSSWRR